MEFVLNNMVKLPIWRKVKNAAAADIQLYGPNRVKFLHKISMIEYIKQFRQ